MKKRMNEAEAWEYLAKLWARHFSGHFVLFGESPCSGLCACLWTMEGTSRISIATYTKMKARLDLHQPRGTRGWYYPRNKAGANKRAALCRKLAKEARKEAK